MVGELELLATKLHAGVAQLPQVSGGHLLARDGSEDQKQRVVCEIAQGTCGLSVCIQAGPELVGIWVVKGGQIHSGEECLDGCRQVDVGRGQLRQPCAQRLGEGHQRGGVKAHSGSIHLGISDGQGGQQIPAARHAKGHRQLLQGRKGGADALCRIRGGKEAHFLCADAGKQISADGFGGGHGFHVVLRRKLDHTGRQIPGGGVDVAAEELPGVGSGILQHGEVIGGQAFLLADGAVDASVRQRKTGECCREQQRRKRKGWQEQSQRSENCGSQRLCPHLQGGESRRFPAVCGQEKPKGQQGEQGSHGQQRKAAKAAEDAAHSGGSMAELRHDQGQQQKRPALRQDGPKQQHELPRGYQGGTQRFPQAEFASPGQRVGDDARGCPDPGQLPGEQRPAQPGIGILGVPVEGDVFLAGMLADGSMSSQLAGEDVGFCGEGDRPISGLQECVGTDQANALKQRLPGGRKHCKSAPAPSCGIAAAKRMAHDLQEVKRHAGQGRALRVKEHHIVILALQGRGLQGCAGNRVGILALHD